MRIVFVHGVGGTQAVWTHQLTRFPDSVAVTLPGHPTGIGRNRIDDYVDFVHDFVRERGIERFMLVGHSMGGGIAQRYAQRFPEDLQALGLFATGARLRVRRDLLDGVLADFPAFVDQMAEVAFGPDVSPDLRAAYRREARQVSPTTIRGDWEACDGFDNLQGLGTIQVPVLIVAGAEDTLTPLRYSEYFHQHLPHSHLVVLPRIGHFVQLEAPEQVNQALADFLRDHTESGAP